MSPYRSAVTVFGLIFIGIGLAMLVVTTVKGGAAFGYIVGVLFIALGLGRLYLLRSRR
jgi:SpoU rRNA methylase family enzyme